jgi:prepilin-type N-terminal cleavage/methylation domain-containing protein
VPKQRSIHSNRTGFTLVEIIVTLALFVLLAITMLTTFLLFQRSFVNVTRQSEMMHEMRRTMEYLGDDIRTAKSVTVNNNSVVIVRNDNTSRTYQNTANLQLSVVHPAPGLANPAAYEVTLTLTRPHPFRSTQNLQISSTNVFRNRMANRSQGIFDPDES